MSLESIASELKRLTHKASQGERDQEDVSGGTFTISNQGVSGSLLAAPIIINQPQSAILGIGKLEKRGGSGTLHFPRWRVPGEMST